MKKPEGFPIPYLLNNLVFVFCAFVGALKQFILSLLNTAILD